MAYILVAILFIGILIALHESGHFLAAKACGVKVEEFSIGMGPRLLHKTGGETEYSLRLLPIGGFCAMEGEGEETSDDPRAFPNRPWWQRLIILLAGVTMNFLTGLLIIALLFSSSQVFYEPVVAGFQPGSQAHEQGLEVGDRIYAIDGHRVYMVDDVLLCLQRREADTVEMTVKRGREKVTIEGYALSILSNGDGTRQVGLGIATSPVEATPLKVVEQAWYQAIFFARAVWISLGDLITGAVGFREMSGIVGMVDMVGEIGQEGAQAAAENEESPWVGALQSILFFIAFISINLAMMNLLPIPALDGGQILLMAVNGVLLKVRGRKMDPRYQGWVSAAGMVCLLALMLAVTVSDVLKKFGI